MTGKEFLWQYIMIDRQIKSVKLQLDSMVEIAKENAMSNVFQDEIADLKNKLKDLISKSARVKKEILDKILLIPNNERREILIKRYLENIPDQLSHLFLYFGKIYSLVRHVLKFHNYSNPLFLCP